ncbi:HNH endonuclease [Devosia sp. 2618]|uniref:HNH endonuclease n=1 Tax=Devosia sp. 2618 TaxID=3156454 RepID=UPI003395261C
MAKLTTLKPRLSKLAPRLSTARAIRDTRYSPDAQVRSWYKSARWQALRLEVLARDLYTCQQTGVLLIGKHPAPNSPVVDHVVPHKGSEQLFWDVSNLQAVSKAYHDSDKRKMEMQHQA